MENAGRIIGIRHRIKQRKVGDEIIKGQPTQVAILKEGEIETYNLEDERAELDWVWGVYPVEYRKVVPGENLDQFKAHQVQWRKLRKNESVDDFEGFPIAKEGKEHLVATKVPSKYDGLSSGDTVAMVLGGSGNRFAGALANRGKEISAEVWRIPPFDLKARRNGKSKDDDSVVLAGLAKDEPALFQKTEVRDIALIVLRERFMARIDAMKERIACEQRLWQRMNGQLFLSEDGGYPEGKMEDLFDAIKANDAILSSLLKEEAARERELVKVIESTGVYPKILKPIQGMGPMIAARLIVMIGDIRRFSTASKLKAYCRQYVVFEKPEEEKTLENITLGEKEIVFSSKKTVFRKLRSGEKPDNTGRFVRRRSGELANWSDEAVKALYLLGDQFNRRPDSVWGQKLLEYKAKFRAKHPEVLCKQCGIPWEQCESKKSHTSIFSNIHLHKRAIWRTVTKFLEWLWREWTRLEKEVTND